MFKKLRSVIYRTPDLNASKQWYTNMLGIEPYFDQPFYVGYQIEGAELGLDPDPADAEHGSQGVAYWTVEKIEDCVKKLEQLGASVRTAVQEVGGGIKVATIKDPWGNTLGLIEGA